MLPLPDNWENLSQDDQLSFFLKFLYLYEGKVEERFKLLIEQIGDSLAIIKKLKESLCSLEVDNALLRSEINDLKESRHSVLNSEILVGGIPYWCTSPVNYIADSILKHMNLESLSADVLEVRPFHVKGRDKCCKSNSHSEIPTFSFIIQFKSVATRNHVLKVKRKLGDFKFSDIFVDNNGPPSNASISLYEMLAKPQHNLRLLLKDRAKKCGYKYVWTWEGCLYTRKNDTTDRHKIVTNADIRKLQS